MNFKGLQDMVKSYGGYGTGDTEFVKIALSDAERALYTTARWDWLHTSTPLVTVAGQAEVSVPADMVFHERLEGEDTPPPVFEQADNFHSTARRLRAEGRPAKYTLLRGQIVFAPIPDRVYTYRHDYWRMPELMDADTDVPAVPDRHVSVLAYGALVKMAARDKDVNMVQYWAAEEATVLARMRQEEAFEQFATVERIPYPARYGGRLRG